MNDFQKMPIHLLFYWMYLYVEEY